MEIVVTIETNKQSRKLQVFNVNDDIVYVYDTLQTLNRAQALVYNVSFFIRMLTICGNLVLFKSL